MKDRQEEHGFVAGREAGRARWRRRNEEERGKREREEVQCAHTHIEGQVTAACSVGKRGTEAERNHGTKNKLDGARSSACTLLCFVNFTAMFH